MSRHRKSCFNLARFSEDISSTYSGAGTGCFPIIHSSPRAIIAVRLWYNFPIEEQGCCSPCYWVLNLLHWDLPRLGGAVLDLLLYLSLSWDSPVRLASRSETDGGLSIRLRSLHGPVHRASPVAAAVENSALI